MDHETGEIMAVASVAAGVVTHGEPDALGKLFCALAKAQGEIADPIKDSKNPHLKNKYADLTGYLQAARPVLSKNELCLSQMPVDFGVITILGHAGGGFLQSFTPVKLGEGKGLHPAQVYGSAVSYARRYAVASILGMGADDDDAAGAGGNTGGGSDSKAGADSGRHPGLGSNSGSDLPL